MVGLGVIVLDYKEQQQHVGYYKEELSKEKPLLLKGQHNNLRSNFLASSSSSSLFQRTKPVTKMYGLKQMQEKMGCPEQQD